LVSALQLNNEFHRLEHLALSLNPKLESEPKNNIRDNQKSDKTQQGEFNKHSSSIA